MRPTSTIDALLQEIQDLREARDLLDTIWVDLGPYRTGTIPDAVWSNVQRYFEFDDSE